MIALELTDPIGLLKEDSTGKVLVEDGLLFVDSFIRGDQANFGTATGGDNPLTWPTGATSSILSNKGRITLGAGGTLNLAFSPSQLNLYDVDVRWMFRCSNVTSFDHSLLVRHDGASAFGPNYVWAGVDISSNLIILYQTVSGVGLTIATASSAGFLAATDYWFRLQVIGTTAQMKYWKTTDAEPGAWTLSGTTQVTNPGGLGTRNFATTAVNHDIGSLTVGRIGINDNR